ncbi:MAG: glycosyltransferase family 61 protein [Methylobacterium frigidaeris]
MPNEPGPDDGWRHLRFGGLQKTTDLWGGDEIFAGQPKLVEARNVYYVPWEHNGRWGIFDSNDHIIESAIDRAHPSGEMLQQVPESPVHYDDINLRAIDSEYIYGGRFHPHFGHFLVEALPRYWMLAQERRRFQKILVHTDAHENFFGDFPFARIIFTALGLTRGDFLKFPTPAKIDKLLIPETSLRPQAFGYEAYGELCRYIGKRLLGSEPIIKNPKPVWLSKTKLQHGVSRFINEDIIERRLLDAGFDIIYPEELGFVDQIKLFTSRLVIAGTTGSAFHTSLFTEPNAKLIMIDPVGFRNSNFSIFEKLSGHRVDHYFPAGTEMIPDPTFIRCVAFPEPEKVADAIIALVRS